MRTMTDSNVLAVLSVPATFLDYAGSRSAHWRSEWSCIVNAVVKLPNLQDRMPPPSVSRGDAGAGDRILQRDDCPTHPIPAQERDHRAREAIAKDLVRPSAIVH